MPIKYTFGAVLATVCLFPVHAGAQSNFSYDFWEVAYASVNTDNNSYTSVEAAGSMEIQNSHYLTASIKTDITSGVSANEIGIGIGAYKASSESTDLYSRAGVKHGTDSSGSHQTASVGFGARHQLSDAIQVEGGIDFLFSNSDETTGVNGTLNGLYSFSDATKLGIGMNTNGNKTETRFFARVKML